MIEDKERELNLEARTHAVVQWLKLTDIPRASDLDPENKLGVQDIFNIQGERCSRIIPLDVIKEQKRRVSKTKKTSVETPLLEKQVLGDTTVPLFKEQVYAAAQQLVELGLEIPEAKMIAGEGFAMGTRSEASTLIKTRGKIVVKYRTKDPNISVLIEKKGHSDSEAEKITLSFHK